MAMHNKEQGRSIRPTRFATMFRFAIIFPRPAAFLSLFVIAVALAVGSRPADAQSDGELRALLERIERLEQELAAVRGVVANSAVQPGQGFPGQPRDPVQDFGPRAGGPQGLVPSDRLPGAVGGEAGGPALARILVRVDQLESQLGRMTGELERLQFRYERLNTTVNQLAQDVNGVGSVGNAGGETSIPVVAPNVRSQPPAPLPNAEPDTGNADGAAPVDPVGQPAAAAPPAAPPTQPVGEVGLTGSVRVDYKTALDLLYKGEFAEAENAFRRFTEAYPDSEFLGEAYYWIGEALYVRELYKPAAEAYLMSARDYPENTKAADSLLKLAFTFKVLGEGGQACRALKQLTDNYPSASEPVKRSVRKARSDFRCA